MRPHSWGGGVGVVCNPILRAPIQWRRSHAESRTGTAAPGRISDKKKHNASKLLRVLVSHYWPAPPTSSPTHNPRHCSSHCSSSVIYFPIIPLECAIWSGPLSPLPIWRMRGCARARLSRDSYVFISVVKALSPQRLDLRAQ